MIEKDERKQINSYFIVGLCLLAALTVFSIIPMFSSFSIDKYFDSDIDETYRVLLQIILIVCFPLMFNQFLEFREAWQEEQERHIWLSKSILVTGLVIPTLFELIFLDFEFYKYLKISFVIVQKGFILFGISGTMFKVASVTEPKSFFCFENLSISLLSSVTLLQLCTSIYIITQNKNIYSICGFFLFLVLILLITILVRQIYNKRPISFSFQFRNDLDYRDFCNTTVLLAFFIANFVGIGMHFSSSIEEIMKLQQTNSYLKAIIVFVVLFILIKGRVAVSRASRGERTLKARLDMLRYCSHEMRTPLNTAFLGLEFQAKYLQDLIEFLNSESEIKVEIETKNEIKNENKSNLELGDANPVQEINNGNSGIPTNEVKNENHVKTVVHFSDCKKGQLPETQALLDKDVNLVSILEDLLENIEEVKGSCNVVLQSLNELLMFDKLDEDKVSLECNMTNPWAFINETSKPLVANAKHSNINLNISCENEETLWFKTYHAKIDSYRLSQVVRNFISNALKFTSELGNVTVQLLLKKRNIGDEEIYMTSEENNDAEGYEPGPYLMRLEVIDSGAGISKENQKKLFGQYVQFNANVLQQGKGSGLGLWISKRIIELHGGEIGAFSAGEGLGSTFYFELPLYYKKNEKSCSPGDSPRSEDYEFVLINNNEKKSENQKLEVINPKNEVLVPSLNLSKTLKINEVLEAEKNKSLNENHMTLSSRTFTSDSDISEGRMLVTPRDKNVKIRRNSISRNNTPFSPMSLDSSSLENDTCRKLSIQSERSEYLGSKWESGLNFLVVDDSGLNRKMLKQLLSSAGQYVEEAKNGEEALSVVKNQIKHEQQWMYDVILMDSNMPIMSGPEATREIRKLNFTGLIFGVTGDTDKEQKDYFLKCGANRVLQKPINIEMIEQAIENSEKL